MTYTIMDRSLWSWGYNYYGQLGDGTNTLKTTPTLIESNTDWVSVIAGGDKTMALKGNNTLCAWGNGPLGDGKIWDMYTPTIVNPFYIR